MRVPVLTAHRRGAGVMQNAISVRPIRTEDHAAWKALWDGYNAGHLVAVL
jgi:hypothetical protein